MKPTRTLLVLLTLALALPARAGDDGAATARTFARHVLGGEGDAAVAMMADVMKSAMPAEMVATLSRGLRAKSGEVRRIGEPWQEFATSKYTRFRVPVEFEKATLDLRIVLDGAGKVAGLFVVSHVPPPDAAEARPPEGVREREVEVGPADRALPGTLTLPPGDGPFPGVVLVHGSGPNDRDESIGPNKPFRDLAFGLAARGVAVLRYEKRSRARPGDLTALGAEVTVKEEVIDDARAALALLRAEKEVDAKRVYLLGHSLGGTLAPRIAGTEPRPAGLIVLAGATLPLPEKVLAQVRYITALDGRVTEKEKAEVAAIQSQVEKLRRALEGKGEPPEGPVLGAPIGYYRDLEAHDPPAEAAKLGLPILILQGGRDYQVTKEDLARWRAALDGKPFASFRVYPALDHLFRAGEGPSGPADYERKAPVAEEVIADVATWVKTGHLPAPPPKDGK